MPTLTKPIIRLATRDWYALVLWVFLVGLAFLTNPALAQDEERQEDPAIEEIYYQAWDLYDEADYQGAMDAWKQTRVMAESSTLISDYRRVTIPWNIGECYRRLRYHEPALAYNDSARQLAIKYFGPEDELVGDILLERNVIESQMMRLTQAKQTALEAMAIFEKIYGPESRAVGIMNMNLALDLYKGDEFEEAEVRYMRAKELFDKTLEPDDENMNRFYNNMGMLYRKKKDYTKALEYATTALDYKLKHYGPTHPSVGKYYHNLALTYEEMGDLENALVNMEKSTETLRVGLGEDHPEYAGSLAEMAGLYIDMGDPQRAYDIYLKANKIIAARIGATHPYAVAGMTDLAICYEEMGEMDKAIEQVKGSMRILSESDDVFFPQIFDNGVHLAYLYKKQGRYEECRHICDSLLRVLLDRQKLQGAAGFQTEYRFQRMDVLEERGDSYWLESDGSDVAMLESAWSDYNESLGIINDMRREVASEESQYQIYEESVWLYDASIQVATAMYARTGDRSYISRALELCERSKASILRGALLDRTAAAFGGIPEEILAELTEYDDRVYIMEDRMRNSGSDIDADTVSVWQRELIAVRDERDALIDRIELEYPQYYSIKYEETALNIPGLQEELAGTNRAIVSYYIDDEGGHAFYISTDRLEYAPFDWSDEQSDWIASFGEGEFMSTANSFDSEASRQLFDLTLAPFIEFMDADEVHRLMISPHAELCYLPFDLLKMPGQNGTDLWLVEKFAISYTPSVQLLNSVRQNRSYDVAYAGFAPVYDDDESAEGMFALRNDIAPLPATAYEIQQSSELFDGMAALRQDATVDAFQEVAGEARIIHLATHATVYPEAPLDSYLHFYASDATGVVDRKYSMFEIYRTHIPADLVILSACQTGQGDLRSGEGPMSLARAFQYAGSRSVVMNQWPANDRSSKSITVKFLENVADGDPKDVALQKAKVEYINSVDPLRAHPYFWAGLSLYGESEPLPGKPGPFLVWMMILGTVVLCVWATYQWMHD